MRISEEDLKKVQDLADWVESGEGGWRTEVMRTFGRRKFLESGDVSSKREIPLLIEKGLAFEVIHSVEDYNSPDYGITHLGYQVYEILQYRSLNFNV